MVVSIAITWISCLALAAIGAQDGDVAASSVTSVVGNATSAAMEGNEQTPAVLAMLQLVPLGTIARPVMIAMLVDTAGCMLTEWASRSLLVN